MMRLQPIPDTFWTIQEELALFGGSVLLGIPAGILFDAFRLFRRCIRHPVTAAAVEDVLWMLGVSVMLLCYASACAKGVFRAYYAAGCFLGFVVYELTLGSPTIRLLDAVRRILCLPFRVLGKIAASICTKINNGFVRIIQSCRERQEKKKKRLQAGTKKVYNSIRHQRKGNAHGKNKTSGRSSAARSASAPARGAGAVHRRLYHRVHQYAELDHREKTGDGGAGGEH